MKIKLLILVAVLSFSFTNAQIVNIPDPILKAKLLQATASNGTASSQTPVYNATSGTWSVTSYNSIDTNGDGEIEVSEAQAIKWFGSVNLTITDVTGMEAFTNLEYLNFSGNQLQNFTITGLTHLRYLNVGHNYLQTLDVSSFSSLAYLWCYDNQMQTLFMKNDANWVSLGFDANFDMKYVCADENDLTFVQNKITQYGYSNCHVHSYCSFTPGGTFYTIYGTNRYDFNNDGCGPNDSPFPDLKINITNGSQSGTVICNSSGNYSIPVQAGTHTLTPVLENPTYYTTNSAIIPFPASTSSFNQDFCIVPNGIHHDVEISIIPIRGARPGFDANYMIVYKNKGTGIESGSIQFSFDDTVLDLVSTDPLFSSQTTNTLYWNYSYLQPFETRTILLTVNLNSPTETPALNVGNHLNYAAMITTLTNDEMPFDNTFGLNQIVVASYDPNDKTCLQGNNIDPSYVGNYVYYMIRFENTGTSPAENVVVKDMIDTTKFNIASLIPISGSHSFVTRITNTNQVEFIFENINLPFEDAANDGYVVFKIKTQSNLAIGDTFSNAAKIYFDYNYPITTNNYTSTIQTLGINEITADPKISIYPNPVKDIVYFNTQETVIKVEIYDTAGRIISSNAVHNNKISLSDLQTGNYILKVYTENGITSTKIIKE